MIINRKSDITIKALEQHDELITYTVKSSGTCSSLKLRTIDGKQTYIADYYNGDTGILKSKAYTSLAAAKKNETINHF